MTDARNAAYAALLLRLALGALLLAHAGLKIFVFTVPGTVQFFQSLGYPGFFAHLTILGELAGGAALILGVQTRLAALATLPILVGAAAAHWGNGWLFSAQGGGWEFPAFWIVAHLVQALLGDGAHALRIALPGRLRAA
ncbi:MAG TPA: DoxX family protein [Alphaproteobacteria bacterium]|nr:DoxX family protein [Alphaproteobacteria bacterium]